MGKFANQSAYREYERIQNRRQDESLESEPEATEFEKASEWDDLAWERKDSEPLPRSVRLFDEYPRTHRIYGGF